MSTKKKITVLINQSVGNGSYVDFLKDKYEVQTVDSRSYGGEKIDLLLFSGGEDVNPRYYDESVGKYTAINSNRDSHESEYMFHRRDFRDVPKLGICRGAQFLTVMSGGELIQHVNNHAIGKLHPIYFKSGRYEGMMFNITSTHHQMMYPYNLNKDKYQIIATTEKFLSTTYLNGRDEEKELSSDFEECEIVWYPDSKSLCIQGHPEFANCPSDTREVCLQLIEQYLNL